MQDVPSRLNTFPPLLRTRLCQCVVYLDQEHMSLRANAAGNAVLVGVRS